MSKKNKNKGLFFFIFILLVGFGGFYVYRTYFLNTAHFKDKNYMFLYIKSDETYDEVLNTIRSENIIDNFEAFEWMAKQMNLSEHLHPGKYRITNGMNARQIINLLKYDKQEKIKLTYNSQIHTLEEFVRYTDQKLELSDEDLEGIINDEKKLEDDFQLNPDNCFALITPGSYEVSWAISAKELFEIFRQKYTATWNEMRKNKAKKLGYSVPEIITMASIVQSESSIKSEQEKIAGVYFNRLAKEMLLQADPTLKFANGNYEAQRILNEDKEINSPYNTYRYKGLPPGPIALVNLQAIDATLNYNKHRYIFFCAKPDLNGYSDFSVNYEQHQKFANAYQKAMDKKGINR